MYKNKLCIIYTIAPHYRKGIFEAVDKEWDCDWYFGNALEDIGAMDTSILNHVSYFKNKVIRYPIIWQESILRLLFNNDYGTFLMLGDTNTISNWVFAFLKKIFCPRKKIYYWTHGWYGKEGWMKRKLKKLFYNSVDGVFLYGNYAKNLMIENGFPPNNLFVIHNSLDYDSQLAIRAKCKSTDIYKSHFGNTNPNLIFIGRLTPIKSLDYAVEAIYILRQRGVICNLTLIGDGPMRTKLQRQVANLGMEDVVWFYGASFDDNKNAELIYNADLCVSPGNVGLTAMHTMMYGTPVATHNDFKNQMPEFEAIHDGVTGTFFAYHDSSSLASTIQKWLETNSDREVVRQNCFKEIDTLWTPEYQLNVLRNNLQFCK